MRLTPIQALPRRKNDIRKPMKVIIEADTEFQSKLRALKDSASTNATEAKQFLADLNMEANKLADFFDVKKLETGSSSPASMRESPDEY